MPTELTLKELGFMYGTDKTEHGYLEFYQQYLPKNPKKILEIGVKEGRSIKMWRHFFPETEIHGLDLFEEFPIPEGITNCKFWKGNQCDWQLLEQLRKEDFEVVIDDGSHGARDQMMTFFGLFNGKHYFIEDLHCNKDEFYSQGMPYPLTASGLFVEIENATYGGNTQNIDFNVISGTNITLIKCS